MQLPFFNKVYQLKRKRSKDLPDLPEILSGEMLSIRDDFYRVLTRRLDREKGEVEVNVLITMYYNVFALAFGYDTLELYLESNGTRKHVKYINLYERLDSREQAVIDYINGSIKHMKEIDKALVGSDKRLNFYNGSYVNPTNEKVRYKDLFKLDDKEAGFTGINFQSVANKFPEVKMHGGRAYMYRSHYYEDSDNARNSSPALKIPLTRQFKEIAQMSRMITANVGGDDDRSAPFREMCHRLVSAGIDPLMVFVKSNFLKPMQSRVELSDMNSLEKDMLSHFIKASEIGMPEMIGDNDVPANFDSDVILSNSFTNLKRIRTVLFFEGFDENMLKDLKVVFTKRADNSDIIGSSFDVASKVTAQSSFCNIGRVGDLGGFPVSFPVTPKVSENGSSSSPRVDVAIERDQFDDEDIAAYSASRVISRNPSVNSSYMVKDLKLSEKLITTCIQPNTADNLLRRDFVQNLRTGEMILNSTITPNKALGLYTRNSVEQRVDAINIIPVTISRGLEDESRRLPLNVLKILNKHPDLVINRVLCQPEHAGSVFEIPVTDERTNEIIHGDPIPGARYTYRVFFGQIDGAFDPLPVERKHRTLPMGMKNIGLSIQSKTETSLRIKVEEDVNNNLASKIDRDLNNIFASGAARSFYDEFFRERVTNNLQKIGSLYQLYVQIFNKRTNYVTSTDGSSERKKVFESIKDESGNCYFEIPIGGNNSDLLITYHLIISNPLELVGAGFDEIEDPKTREIFSSRTAAYFNTFSLTNGQLPAEVISADSKDKFYAHSSKLNYLDPFNRISCIGGMVETNQTSDRQFHEISNLQSVYNPDDGECIVGWTCSSYVRGAEQENYHIDFFVVTAEVNGLEIPIDGRPFIGYTDYKVRTTTFLGAAAKVKFRVYIVYNDFFIQRPSSVTEAFIKDIRKRIQE